MTDMIKTVTAKSWKTTAAGVASGVAILAHQAGAYLDADPLTVVSIEAVLTGFGLILTGFFARDKNVSSEQQRGEVK